MHAAAPLYRAQHLAMLASTALIIRGVHLLLDRRARAPGGAARDALGARFKRLLDDDLANVRRGCYSEELLFSVPFRAWAKVFPEALVELPRFVARSRRKGHDELPPEIDRDRYPRYYLRNFHWQTDGWLSARSARLYDYEVELLFGGVADVMRRQLIPAVKEGVADVSCPRILDVATGTGRFLLQLAKTLPRARLFGLDLSRPYLDHASRLLGDADVSLIHENAEQVPFAKDTFDAVTSIFLFHELPRDARRRIHAEAFRVLAPGRRYVVVDSGQRGDADEIMEYLELFPKLYHEPYYASYLADPIEDGMAAAGFAIEEVRPVFTGKMVVGRKPHA
jgi:ubiquinone/menaquinone biosynthesis C-methylase UbiE